MHIPRIYIDTSVIGGCFDQQFAYWSNELFNQIMKGTMIAIISEITLKEIEDAPFYVKEKLLNIPEEFSEVLPENTEVEFLAEKYIEHQAIPPSCVEDDLHIAYSTIYNVDVLVSWNFKHIVNLNRIKGGSKNLDFVILAKAGMTVIRTTLKKFNSVNLFYGYKTVEIRSPKEVIDNEL